MKLLPLLLVVLLAGCAPTPAPSASSGLRLPIVQMGPADGTPEACAGVGLSAVLRGDPGDPRVAWLDPYPQGGGWSEVIWPAGFSARFVPRLEILDASGHVVIQGGDFVNGGCVIADPRVLLLEPPFLALRLDCGPIDAADCTSGRIYQVASANGWPERAIAEVQFATVDGGYRLVFEDGSVVTGSSSQP